MTSSDADLTRRLRQLGNQAMKLAGEVASRSADSQTRTVFSALQDDDENWLIAAQDCYSTRRLRSSFFPADLFGEPAWDILLDLYISEKMNRPVSVTSACIASDAPPTTALRWLHQIESAGLIEREPDRQDARRSFVKISENGYACMTAYLKHCRSSWTARSSAAGTTGSPNQEQLRLPLMRAQSAIDQISQAR